MPDARLKKTREAYVDNRTPTERREDEERAARDNQQDQRGKVLAKGLSIRFVRQYDVTADVNPPRFACEWPKHWNTIEADHHPWKDGYADVTFPKLPILQPLDEQ